MSTHYIPEHNLDFLKTSIEKLNRKAIKLNCEPIKLDITSEFKLVEIIETFNEDTGSYNITHNDVEDPLNYSGNNKCIKLFKCEIEGKSPIINGFQFLAKIEGTPEGNILYISPNCKDLIDPKWRTAKVFCDHCQINRNRVNTYLVQNVETNEIKQVGSSCLHDFLGHKNPEQLAALAELMTSGLSEIIGLSEEDGLYEGGGGGKEYYSLKRVLTMAAAIIRLNGWMSVGNAELMQRPSTRDNTTYQLFTRNISERDRVRPEEQDEIEGTKAIEWAKSLTNEQLNSDYLANLNIIAKTGVCSYKSIGMAVSIIAAYQRAMDTLRLFQRKQKNPSQFIGVIKERKELELTCVNNRSFETAFGTGYLNEFEDLNSNVFVWFTGECLKKGYKYLLKATIKEHKYYEPKKENQTILTRAKILKETPNE